MLMARSGPGVNRTSYDAIEVGMAEADVVTILGVLPGDYVIGKPKVAMHSGLNLIVPMAIDDFRRHRKEVFRPTLREWYTNTGVIIIDLGDDNRVRSRVFFSVIPEQKSLWRVAREWLGW